MGVNGLIKLLVSLTFLLDSTCKARQDPTYPPCKPLSSDQYKFLNIFNNPAKPPNLITFSLIDHLQSFFSCSHSFHSCIRYFFAGSYMHSFRHCSHIDLLSLLPHSLIHPTQSIMVHHRLPLRCSNVRWVILASAVVRMFIKGNQSS